MLVQQNGQAGQDLISESCGWTYVEPSVMATVQNLGIADGKDEDTCDVCSDSETCHGSGTKKSGKSKSKQKKSTKETGGNKGSVAHNGQTLNGNLLWLLHTHEQSHCLEVEKNNIYMEIQGSLLKLTVTKLSSHFHAAFVIHRGIIHLTRQQSCQQSQLRLKISTLTVQESQPFHFLHHSPRPFEIMPLKSSWSLLTNNGHLKKVHDSV